ncbi:exodeoxyribonuclease 8 [Citrobacter phage vB_CfrS_K1M]
MDGCEMKVYLNNELSNEQYHADTEHINGSGLWNILDRCPAAWRYKDEEDEQSKALVFGTGSHTALLEPERFDAEYARMPVVDDFPKDKDGNRTVLVTTSDMNSWAKERGIKGLSGKTKDEVIKIIQATGETVQIYDVIREEAEKAATGKSMLEGDDYDAIMQMRAVIHANSYYSSLLAGAYAEVSILGELNGELSKVRFDCLTKGGDIIDYKTTVSAKPDEFFRHAARLGYFMKMAMQHDMFVAAYGHAPRSVNLLVQEKKAPFIPALIRLTDEQLRIGRIQLNGAMEIYKACKKANSWPGYSMGNPVIEMETPEWFKKQFNL